MNGTFLLLLGSIGCLIAEQLFEPTYLSDGTDNETTTATSTTALVLCGIVIGFALLALVFYVLTMRIVKQKEETQRLQHYEDARRVATETNNQKKRSLLEWFFYPEFQEETAPKDMSAKHRNLVYKQLSWNRRSRILLLAPSVALFALIVVRLFLGADNFEGDPSYLDFGWKYGLLPHDRTVEENGDELYNEPAEKSIAYIVEFNSYGHAIQGFVSSFLAFPAVFNFLIRFSCSAKPSSSSSTTRGFCSCIDEIWKNVVLLAPYAFTIYPSYNLIKRYLKAGEAFAGSSFSNNGFEWSSGFVIGLAIGNFLTSIVLWTRISKEDEDYGDDENNDSNNYIDPDSSSDQQQQQQEVSNKSSPPWWKVWEPDPTDGERNNSIRKESLQENPTFCVKLIQVLFGLLLVFTAFAASVLFGTTWHGCLDGSPDQCVNYSEDGDRSSLDIFISFIVIPSVIFVGTILLECGA